jgi:hypothetical protein
MMFLFETAVRVTTLQAAKLVSMGIMSGVAIYKAVQVRKKKE